MQYTSRLSEMHCGAAPGKLPKGAKVSLPRVTAIAEEAGGACTSAGVTWVASDDINT